MSHDNPMTIGFIGDEMISLDFAKQKLELKKKTHFMPIISKCKIIL